MLSGCSGLTTCRIGVHLAAYMSHAIHQCVNETGGPMTGAWDCPPTCVDPGPNSSRGEHANSPAISQEVRKVLLNKAAGPTLGSHQSHMHIALGKCDGNGHVLAANTSANAVYGLHHAKVVIDKFIHITNVDIARINQKNDGSSPINMVKQRLRLFVGAAFYKGPTKDFTRIVQ
jgi:hypothetical protein